MNAKTSKLIRKSITASTKLEGDKLRQAIREAKRSYNLTPRPHRAVIKEALRHNI